MRNIILLLLFAASLQAQVFDETFLQIYPEENFTYDDKIQIYYDDYDRLERDWNDDLSTIATLMFYYDRYEKDCYSDSFLYKGFELIPYDDPNYPNYQYIVEWRYTHPTFVGFIEYLRTMQK
jgi:hypothetical protein